jgi:hypothetical protein
MAAVIVLVILALALWLGLLGRARYRKSQGTLICMRQADTWRWSKDLGEITPGVCERCGAPIFFEKQNGYIRHKICHVCGYC